MTTYTQSDYRQITAADLLAYIERTHQVGGAGNCFCVTCQTYGAICGLVGRISADKQAARERLHSAGVVVRDCDCEQCTRFRAAEAVQA